VELYSLSASSLQTFEECPRRWYAEYVDRLPRIGGSSKPAALGTTVHNTLEAYVTRVFINCTDEASEVLLTQIYQLEFMKEMREAPSPDNPLYNDGLEMLVRWYERTDLSNLEVLMLENKLNVMIKTKKGPKKLTYIFDRVDLLKENGKIIVRVVDYKTIRQPVTPEQLRQKIQARMYGMLAQMLYKDDINPDEIWVCFDLLRYGPVEVKFSRDDNVDTWKYMKATANRIIDTPGKGEEHLSPGCQFCPLKATCKTLAKNADNGGLMHLAGDRDALAARRLELESQQKGVKYALEEIDNMMLEDAIEADEISYETENFLVEFASQNRSSYPVDKVKGVVGAEYFSNQMGGKATVTAVNKALKSGDLDSGQRSMLRSLVVTKFSEPKPKVSAKVIK
jgi:RecB family exonuclease